MGVVEGLRDACPALALHTDAPALAAAGLDAMRPSRGRPEFARLDTRPIAVAEPASAAEVAALVRWAAGARVPLVARGGGSGLMGAAAVLVPAVVVDLRRLGAVAVDADACLVRAGAGATLAQVDAALAPHGLMLGHDPWTVGVATVGGALATNGLGYLGARAGSFGAQVRALEAVLADGTIVRTRSASAGPPRVVAGRANGRRTGRSSTTRTSACRSAGWPPCGQARARSSSAMAWCSSRRACGTGPSSTPSS